MKREVKIVRQKRRALFWDINSETDFKMGRVREKISRVSGFKGQKTNKDVLDFLADFYLKDSQIDGDTETYSVTNKRG